VGSNPTLSANHLISQLSIPVPSDNPQPDLLTDRDIENLANRSQYIKLKMDDLLRMHQLCGHSYSDIHQFYLGEHAKYQEALKKGDLSIIQDEVDNLLTHHAIQIERGSEVYQKLCYNTLLANFKAARMQLDRHQGEIIDTPPMPESYQKSLRLSEIADLWKREKEQAGSPSKTTADALRQIHRFINLHGNLPVRRITKTHVREFKDSMLKQGLSSRTVQEKCLAFLKAILNWAVNNGYVDDNPANGITVSRSKVEKTARLPYSVDDLNKIFRFPVFTSGERPKAGGGDAAKWIPLLALFTGARLEELGQLHVADVKITEGIRYLDMTTVEEGKRYKTRSSRRKIPIHPELIRLGFMDYVDERRKAGDERLFPEVRSSNESVTAAWSKWWGRYVRKHGITDSRKVFHSFRHTVKDAFRDSGVDIALNDAIMGHTQGNVSASYGQGYSLKVLAEAMKKLDFLDWTWNIL
jgi:integrase